MNQHDVSFGDVLSDAGRSDYCGTYHANSYGAGNSKFDQRKKVLDYILRFFPDESRFPVKMLSFPGISWIFENMISLSRPRCHFVGLESSRTVYLRSRVSIPWNSVGDMTGGNSHLQDRSMTYGNGSIVYSRKAALRGSENQYRNRKLRSHRLLLMDAEVYATMLHTDYGASLQQKKEFYQKFYLRNCAWLDFTGPVNEKIETIFSHLPICFCECDAPIVVTVLNGRDRLHGVSERIERITRAQPRYVVDQAETYIGKGGVSMLSMYGYIRNH